MTYIREARSDYFLEPRKVLLTWLHIHNVLSLTDQLRHCLLYPEYQPLSVASPGLHCPCCEVLHRGPHAHGGIGLNDLEARGRVVEGLVEAGGD